MSDRNLSIFIVVANAVAIIVASLIYMLACLQLSTEEKIVGLIPAVIAIGLCIRSMICVLKSVGPGKATVAIVATKQDSERLPAKPVEPPLTFAQWLDKMNAKKEKCGVPNGDWVGGGTNGFESWTIRCENGVLVYTDSTAETRKAQDEVQAHKNKLIHALKTRILTDQEMVEVNQIGSDLLVRNLEPYYEDEVERRFQTLLITQQVLRTRGQP